MTCCDYSSFFWSLGLITLRAGVEVMLWSPCQVGEEGFCVMDGEWAGLNSEYEHPDIDLWGCTGSFLVLVLGTHRQTELVPVLGQLLNFVVGIGQESP